MDKNTEFIRGFLRGDSAILHKIYSNSFPIVKRYVLNRDGSMKDAEDIFHNALVLLFVKLKKEKLEIQSFDNYLFTVCKNMWRREIVKKRVTNVDRITLVSDNVDMASFYIEQNQWELYKEKFEELTENCRTILQLLFQKVSYAEIVSRFGYASETVARQRVFKCKSRLIQLIKKDARYIRLKKRS